MLVNYWEEIFPTRTDSYLDNYTPSFDIPWNMSVKIKVEFVRISGHEKTYQSLNIYRSVQH